MCPKAYFEKDVIEITGDVKTWETQDKNTGEYTEHIHLLDNNRNEEMIRQNGKKGLQSLEPDGQGSVNLFLHRPTPIDPSATLEITVNEILK